MFKWQVSSSSKSLRFIFWGTRMSLQNRMTIHSVLFCFFGLDQSCGLTNNRLALPCSSHFFWLSKSGTKKKFSDVFQNIKIVSNHYVYLFKLYITSKSHWDWMPSLQRKFWPRQWSWIWPETSNSSIWNNFADYSRWLEHKLWRPSINSFVHEHQQHISWQSGQ